MNLLSGPSLLKDKASSSLLETHGDDFTLKGDVTHETQRKESATQGKDLVFSCNVQVLLTSYFGQQLWRNAVALA
jgi:hypothetical protein